jgi:phospholipid N-methyltransferase
MMPAVRRFRRMLPDYFSRVTRSRHVWRNLPPAFVIRCEK